MSLFGFWFSLWCPIWAIVTWLYVLSRDSRTNYKLREPGNKEQWKWLLFGFVAGPVAILFCKWREHILIKSLHFKGAEDIKQEHQRHTKLVEAVYLGDLKKVENLLELGFEADAKDDDGWTALMYAAGEGHHEIVRSLIEHGADVNVKDDVRYGYLFPFKIGGTTALMRASRGGHTKTIEELLEKGAEVNVRDGHGHTPIIAAAQGGHSSVIKMLILAGAKIDTKEKTRRVPGWDPSARSPGSGKTALMYAAMGGHDEAVKTLIKSGAKVNQKDKEGWTALNYALLSRDKTTTGHIKTLINNGANVNSKPRGESPILYHAISTGNPEFVRALLEKGANPNTKWKKSTSLKQAKKLGNKEIYMLLRNAGARK